MNQHPEPTQSRFTSATALLRPILHLGLILVLTVASGCGKDEVAEDPALQPPGTYVAPPLEVPPDAATNPAVDGAASRNAPSVPQSTTDEVVDKKDPTGD